MYAARIFMPWMSDPAARSRQLRPRRRLQVEPLENRTALSAGLSISMAELPAELGSVDAARSTAHDATETADSLDASRQTDTGDADAASQVATTVATDAATVSEGVAPPTGAAGTGDSTPVTPAAPDDGDQSGTDSSSDSSQDGSDGGTNTPPANPGAPAPPAAAEPVQTVVDQDDFNPGLLDPLAWTVPDDELSDDAPDAYDAEDLVVPAAGLAATGPSTQMDRVDEVVIGGRSDSHSAFGWRGDSFSSSLLDPEAQALHDRFTLDARNDTIAAGTAPWRSLLSDLNLRDQAGSHDREHIAELSPLDHSSSLALVATLRTMPSRTRIGPDPANEPTGDTNRHVDTEPATSSWKVFVMGLDRAFERSYRDVRRELLVETGLTTESEQSRRDAADRLEWHGPIVPAASPAVLEPSSEASQTGDSAASGQAAGSIVPAVLQLGEFLLENLLDPMLGHENGSHRDSQ